MEIETRCVQQDSTSAFKRRYLIEETNEKASRPTRFPLEPIPARARLVDTPRTTNGNQISSQTKLILSY